MKRLEKAAIKIGDKIFTGWRHSEIVKDIVLGGHAKRVLSKDPQGFTDSEGNFLSRAESLVIARKAGQVGELIGSILTSEDLWDNEGNPLQ